MVDTVAQFNLQFEPVEDRLYLSVKTHSSNEVKLWLTRRYVKLLFNAIDQQQGMIAKHFHSIETIPVVTNRQPDGAQAKHVDDSGTSADALQPTSDYSAADVNAVSDVMPSEPMLVTRVSLQEQPDGHLNLVLGQDHNGGMQMELGLNQELLYTLMHLLDEAARNAEWDLALLMPDMLATETPQGVRLH